MALAWKAAPKPLSMLTTDTPLAQEFSMGEQRGHAAEGGAVAHRGGHRDHRRGDKAAHHGGERALHAGHRHHGPRRAQLVGHVQKPMDAGHAHIVEAPHLVAEELPR